VVVALTAVAFAVQGGEFGTTDLVSQQLRKRKLAAAIDSLERRVDSLTQVKRAIENDPRVQERIAREEFGMVKGDRELLYRFADP
jgi:cell division protein FtsB